MDDVNSNRSSLTNKERTTSMFRIFSIGTVASNKLRNSEYIEVVPLEQVPMVHGELSQATNEYKANSADNSGVAYEEQIAVSSTVKAKWRSIGNSNRMTPPDVRRGEEVVLYQFSDSDEYWWDTMNNLVGLRKLETVVYAWSDTKNEQDNEPSPDNSYVLELSTHDGHITFTTSKSNGEPYRYKCTLNTKDGSFTLTDDIDNTLFLRSKDKHWRMQNTAGSFIEIKDKVINIHADDEVNITTKALSAKTTTTYVKGEKTYEGNATHLGHFNMAGGFSAGAGAGNAGSGTFSGSINVTGDVVAGGISLINHRHRDSGGSGTGGTPV